MFAKDDSITTSQVREAFRKKIWDYLGIFPSITQRTRGFQKGGWG